MPNSLAAQPLLSVHCAGRLSPPQASRRCESDDVGAEQCPALPDIRRIIPEGWVPKGTVGLGGDALHSARDPEPAQETAEEAPQSVGGLTRFARHVLFHTGVIDPDTAAGQLSPEAFVQ